MLSLITRRVGSRAFLKKTLSLCLCAVFFLISLGVPTAQALVESKHYPVNNIEPI